MSYFLQRKRITLVFLTNKNKQMKLSEAQALAEQAIYDYTSSTKWQQVKYMTWTTAEMQDVIAKALVKNIEVIQCCTELNNCFKVGEIVIYNGVKMKITFVDNCQKTANMYCMCDETNWEAVSLSKLTKII